MDTGIQTDTDKNSVLINDPALLEPATVPETTLPTSEEDNHAIESQNNQQKIFLTGMTE